MRHWNVRGRNVEERLVLAEDRNGAAELVSQNVFKEQGIRVDPFTLDVVDAGMVMTSDPVASDGPSLKWRASMSSWTRDLGKFIRLRKEMGLHESNQYGWVTSEKSEGRGIVGTIKPDEELIIVGRPTPWVYTVHRQKAIDFVGELTVHANHIGVMPYRAQWAKEEG